MTTSTIPQRHVYADTGSLIINPGEHQLRIDVNVTPDGYEYTLHDHEERNTEMQPEPVPSDMSHITRELSFSEGIPTQRRVDYINRRITRLRKSVKRLRKGNQMLEALLQQADETFHHTNKIHQNYDEWNEYWVANLQRIDKLEREIMTYQQQIKKFHADPTFRKETSINRAWKQLSNAQGTLAKNGVLVSIHTTEAQKLGNRPIEDSLPF